MIGPTAVRGARNVEEMNIIPRTKEAIDFVLISEVGNKAISLLAAFNTSILEISYTLYLKSTTVVQN